MATARGILSLGRAGVAPATRTGRVRLSWGAELTTVLLGTWLLVGLFVDGWAHNNLSTLETFFTPWHALFYSGFVASAGWMVWQVDRAQKTGRRGLDVIPLGFGVGLVGAVVFAVGGVGDMLWHQIFGIETSVDALFSPTHLLLFVGIALILSTPLRAAWSDPSEPAAPGYRRLLPVLLSVTLVTALVAFMFQFWTASIEEASRVPQADYYPMMQGIAGILSLSLMLTAPLLLLARRWVLPRGAATTLFTIVSLLVAALMAFSSPVQLVALVVAGVAVDLVLAWLRPSAADRPRYWTAGLLIPLVTWSVFFALLALDGGTGWLLEMWTGSIMWAGLLGAALAVLVLPPAVPAAASADQLLDGQQPDDQRHAGQEADPR